VTDPLLAVEDLTVEFDTAEGRLRAVDGVDLRVEAGETVCVVGESGSGKTVAAESITRLGPEPAGRVVGGSVRFDGADVLAMDDADLRALRGDRIAHVFQDPAGSLNPVYSVGWQVVEAVRAHRDPGRSAARERAVELLEMVGIPEAATRFTDYPHQLSGGMQQRVALAMALASRPDLLVADEPTTALDVTTQADVLSLLGDLRAAFDMAVLLVTHDLGVVAQIADRVVVLYAGRVMERGEVGAVFDRPAHPYTRALLACLPGRGEGMEPIGGTLPDLRDPPAGCRFHPRCPHAVGACLGGDQPPEYDAGDAGHAASCVHYAPDGDPSVLDTGADATGTGDGGGESRE
jgi:peptide/nickel transport system ATP-binding protein